MIFTNKSINQYAVYYIILLSFIPRLLAVLIPYLFIQTLPFDGPGHDGYVEIANNWVKYGIFSLDGKLPTFGRAPLLPLLLTPGAFFGVTNLWGMLIFIIIGVLSPLLIFKAGTNLGVPINSCFYLTLFLIFNPWHIWLTKSGLTFVLTTFLLALIYYLISIVGRKRDNYLIIIAIGVLSALMALTHPAYVPLILGSAISISFMLFRNHIKAKTTIISLFILIISWIITMTPWSLRNYYLSQTNMPVVHGYGYQYFIAAAQVKTYLLKGLWPWEYERDSKDLGGLPFESLNVKFSVVRTADANKSLNDKANNDIKSTLANNPFYFIKHLILNIIFLWVGDKKWFLVFSHILYVGTLLIIQTIGLIKFRQLYNMVAIWIVIVPTILVHCFFQGYIPHAAYSIPMATTLVLSSIVAWGRPKTKH